MTDDRVEDEHTESGSDEQPEAPSADEWATGAYTPRPDDATRPMEAAGGGVGEPEVHDVASEQQDRRADAAPHRSTVLTVVLVVLVVGLLAAVAGAVKLHLDRQQVAAAMSESLELLEMAGGDQQVQEYLASARGALEEGDYGKARMALAGVRALVARPMSDGGLADGDSDDMDMAGAPPLPPEAYDELPDGAVDYFRQHEDLYRAFLAECDYSRRLRDSGVDVEDLRQVRDSIVEAARLGQDDRVRSLLEQMMQMNRDKDTEGVGAVAQVPDQLRERFERFRAAAMQAESEGRDLGPAVELLQRSQELAREGQIDQAGALLDQATRAVARGGGPGQEGRAREGRGRGEGMRAQREGAGAGVAARERMRAQRDVAGGGMSRQGGPEAAAGRPDFAGQGQQRGSRAAAGRGQERMVVRGRPDGAMGEERRPERAMRAGPEEGLASYLLDGLLGMVAAEDGDLAAAYQWIDNAKVAVREKNPEQIREILDKALAQFRTIGQRRQQFSIAMNEVVARAQDGEFPPAAEEAIDTLQAQQPRGRGGARGEGRRPDRPERGPQQMRGDYQADLDDLMSRIRSLSDRQFQDEKDDLVAELRMLMARAGRAADLEQQPRETAADPSTGIVGHDTELEKAQAELRIRDKLHTAHEPYMQLRQSAEEPELVAELDKLFASARQALYAQDYLEAEEMVNEGLRKMGIEPRSVLDDEEDAVSVELPTT